MRWLLLVILTSGFRLFAQETEQGTISVQLSRDVWVTPDVAVVTVTVSKFLPISVADAVGILKPAGFAESDVSDATAIGPNDVLGFSVIPVSVGLPTASYTFTRRLTAGQLRAVLNQLIAIQIITFGVTPQAHFEFSEALIKQTQQRQLPGLLMEARREADAIATTSGVRIKELAAVQEIPSPALINQPFPGNIIPASRVSIGVFAGLTPASPIRVQYNFDFLLQ